jgi:hypothetical protein
MTLLLKFVGAGLSGDEGVVSFDGVGGATPPATADVRGHQQLLSK